ncbi:S8 family peptidase [Longispora albida]|uniref:S8 family peptidase n=1 Tax=Longispora albida TaxID=203523 RepID=UPI0003A42B2C|nr:S8 family serine peptidase [Longispora albida]
MGKVRRATLAATLIFCVPGPAAALPAPPGTPSESVADAYRVTLLSGDSVGVTVLSDGRTVTTARPGPGRDHIGFVTRAPRGGPVTVTPADAEQPVAAGVLDPRLFDVAQLRAAGATTSTPVIVSGVPAAGQARPLASLGAQAYAAPPAGLWPQLAAGGPGRVWLDGRSRIADGPSNGQIGVPAARARGLTGAGVTVAVLDTGYDAGHPDLAGRVAGARDFTGAPRGTADGHGHGTHVASIVAGAGEAYPGVAPGANLLVGKVCDDGGICQDSAVIAGMEWAAGQGARVVNLSLTGQPTDGTDPLSQAVNRLSAGTGPLFVAAAGNTGGRAMAGTPATADAALAVGSVGRDDRLSSFSSRGPRVRDAAVKPDLTAPGEGIVAARAAGTSMGAPVSTLHTAASGTSMAAPHVTGSAALLVQAHPGWSAAQLKAALVSTAVPDGLDAFGQGAGRVDIGRASSTVVYSVSGSVSFGTIVRPGAGGLRTAAIRYRNDGTEPVSLVLSVAGVGAPGMFRLSEGAVFVPARGEASAQLILDTGLLGPAGDHSARVVASMDGQPVVRTAVGFTVTSPYHQVTVRLIDRDGNPAASGLGQSVSLYEDETGATPSVHVRDGVGTVLLPAGRYSATAWIRTPKSGQPGKAGAGTVVHQVPVRVDGDREIVLDARTGNLVSVTTGQPDAVQRYASMDVLLTSRAGTSLTMSLGLNGSEPVYAAPVRADRPGSLTAGFSTILVSPGSAYHVATPFGDGVPADPRIRVTGGELGRVDSRYRAQGRPGLGSRGATPFYLPGQAGASGGYATLPLPVRRSEYYSPGVTWFRTLYQRPAGQAEMSTFDGEVSAVPVRYAVGNAGTEEWNKAGFCPELQTSALSNGVLRFGNTLQVMLNMVAPAEAGHSANSYNQFGYLTGTTTLSRDGTMVGSSGLAGFGLFTLPPEQGRYTLDISMRRSNAWSELSSRVDSRWTFTSAAGGHPSLMTIRPSGDFDDLNGAPGFAWFPLDLTVGHSPAAQPSAVREVRAAMSTDDGATWQQVWVLGGTGSAWRAVLFNPNAGTGTGYVSLRLSAADVSGGTVETTIHRAYKLR